MTGLETLLLYNVSDLSTVILLSYSFCIAQNVFISAAGRLLYSPVLFLLLNLLFQLLYALQSNIPAVAVHIRY